MKKIILSMLMAVLLSNLPVMAQETYVNRRHQCDFGSPVFNPILNSLGIQWSQSITGANGELITVGHTWVSGQAENILLTKYDVDGNLLFQTSSFNVSATSNEYGINVYEAPSGDIFVCGTTDNGGSTNYDAVILKYSPMGSLLSSTVFPGSSGLNDFATGVCLNPVTNKLLVSVTNQNTTTGYDYMILELDAVTLGYNNSNTYDGFGLDDIALGVEVDATTGDIMVIGGSQSSMATCAYAVAAFKSSLSYLSVTRTDLSGSPYDMPLAYKKDASNHLYITGKTLNGTNFDLKTVKINPNYTIAWTQVQDFDGLDDIANTLDIDPTSGDVVIGGFCTKAGGLTDMVSVRYQNSTGTIVGTPFRQVAENPSGSAAMKKLVVGSSGQTYFTAAEVGNSGYKQVVVGRLNAWQKKISDNSQDILPSDIDVSQSGIYAISVKDSATDHYVLTSYEELTLDTARVFMGGSPVWMKDELLVAFNPGALNKSVIDNDKQFGDLREFLTPAANTAVMNAFGAICGECRFQAVKVFSQKTTDTLGVSRQGENVQMPSFWATLQLKLPVTVSALKARDVFKTIPDVAVASQVNGFVELTGVPNDSLYANQGSLHPTPAFAVGHINVEEAWNIASGCGSSAIKGGIFDTGVMFRHKDFAYNGSSDTSGTYKMEGWYFSGSYSSSASTGGVDMRSTDGFLDDSFLDYAGHGTRVAGIIGALRNNGSGIAGVAGGDMTNGNPGAKLYSLNVAAYNMKWLLVSYYEVHTGPAFRVNPMRYAYGVDFSNHSYKIVPGWWPVDSFPLVAAQVHHANRMGVTFVASRGNDSVNKAAVPATIDPDWAISVGGSNAFGTRWVGSSYGQEMDVLAPAVTQIITSTSRDRKYNTFSGTSAAAPHVSGVVALLMDYMRQPNDAYMNLNPEDCDFIIQRSAADLGPPGYDSLNGYGRLDAGKALRMVEKPVRSFYHFGTNTHYGHAITKSLHANWDTIRLKEPYENFESPKMTFAPGKYIVKIFKINATVNHTGLYPTDSIMYAWPRHSKSHVYGLPNSQKELALRERVVINSLGAGSANLTGYVYQVKDSTGVNLGWWPCDTTFARLNLFQYSLMEYSVLSKNKAVGIKENHKDNSAISVFPNPASQVQTIVIDSEKEANCTIELFDIMGRKIKTVYEGKLTAGKNPINHQVASLPNSMYIYIIRTDERTSSRKFIKE